MCVKAFKEPVLHSKIWDALKYNRGELPQHTLTESCCFSPTYRINSDQELDWHKLEKQQALKKKLGGKTSSSAETMKHFSNPGGHSL